MPRAPQYRPGQVRLAADPGVKLSANANAASFGGAQARDLAGFGDAITRTGQNILSWANRPEVKRAEQQATRSSAMDRANKFMADARKLNQDYFTREGESATKILGEATEQYNSLRTHYLNDLEDPEAQSYFTRAVDGFMNSNLGKISNHQIRATEANEKAVRTAWNAELIEQGVLNWNDFTSEDGHVQHLNETAANIEMNNAGQAPEVRERLVKESQYMYTAKVLAAIEMNEGPDAALKALDQFEKLEAVDPRTKGKVKKDLQRQEKDTQYRNEALELYHGKTPEQQAEYLREKVKDPQKAKVMEFWLDKWNRDDADKQKALKSERIEALWTQVEQNVDSITEEDIARIPDHKLRDDIRSYIKKYREKGEAWDAQNMRNLESMDTQTFLKQDLSNYQVGLSPSNYRKLVKLQDDLTGKNGDDAQKKASINGQNRTLFNNYLGHLKSSGTVGSELRNESIERYNTLFETYQSRLEQEKPKTFKDNVDLIKDIAEEVTLNESYWGLSKDVKRRGELTEEERATVETAEEQAERQRLTEELNTNRPSKLPPEAQPVVNMALPNGERFTGYAIARPRTDREPKRYAGYAWYDVLRLGSGVQEVAEKQREFTLYDNQGRLLVLRDEKGQVLPVIEQTWWEKEGYRSDPGSIVAGE